MSSTIPESLTKEEDCQSQTLNGPCIVIGIETSEAATCFLEWLRKEKPPSCYLVVVHVVHPAWFVDPPLASLQGLRMVEEHQKQVRRMELLLEECKKNIEECFPSLTVSCLVKTGEPIPMFLKVVADHKAHKFVWFSAKPRRRWNFFSKSIAQTFAPCNVELVIVDNKWRSRMLGDNKSNKAANAENNIQQPLTNSFSSPAKRR